MKPKEKAKDLVFEFCNIDSDSKMYDGFKMPNFYAQRCALIAVYEIIEEVREFCDDNFINDRLHYWEEVKQEIEKL